MVFAVPAAVQAQTLAALLERARAGEPAYLGARTQVRAAEARKAQAIGAMLPQVNASGSANSNDRNYVTRDKTTPEARDQYKSSSAQISLTQPIWRYANIAGWRQARSVVAQAEYQLGGAEQELFAKLVNAWFDLMAARDAVNFTSQQADAQKKQWDVSQRGYELGIIGQPQLRETRTKFDQARSDAVTAETDVEMKRAALEALVGSMERVDLPFVRAQAVLADPGSEKLETWLERVEAGNPNILAATHAYQAASEEVRKQLGGHLPTLDLVASYGKNTQDVGGFPGQAGYDITLGTVGLQLNIPLYAGGAQSAKVDEAQAQKEKARLDVEVARRNAILATKQAWFGWQAANARARAGQEAIRSARSALAVARSGEENGLKTELDTLIAEQQLRAALRDHRKGRYDQVVAYVKLKAVSGILLESDVTALDLILSDKPNDADQGDGA